MGSDAESLEAARRLLSIALDEPMEIVPPGDDDRLDIRSPKWTHVAEVKRITSNSLRELEHVTAKNETSRDVPELRRRWLVALEAKTNSDVLPPMPRFDEPSPEQKRRFDAHGLTVTSKAAREAAFQDAHPDQNSRTPKVKGMIDRLIPHLQALEDRDVTENSRAWAPWFGTDQVSRAQLAILGIVHDGLVQSWAPGPDRAGVDVCLGWGYIRTDRPDTIAGRIQTWLDSGLASNLIKSLAWAPEGARRHAVLVFDAVSEPEFELMSSDSVAVVPNAGLRLPPQVDELWAVFDGRAFSYDDKILWRAHAIGT
ncbi:hypothetical protein [Microbacterium gubbeenense]|uniref:hypothetical protein n=1 Tax=Microbacterium TaxID=33882 RepID=UPI003F963265